MMTRYASRGCARLACVAIFLAACDDGGGASSSADAGMDGGAEGPRDADTTRDSSVEDSAVARDSGPAPRDAASAQDAAVDPYQCRPAPDPGGTIAVGQPCCDGLGTCVAVSGDAGTTLGVGDCHAAQALRCSAAAASGDAGADAGADALSPCRYRTGEQDAGEDYEGRCVPECLTRGTSTRERGGCQAEFVCVPCYNLITGASTGVCDTGGDHPADPAPAGFARCGESLGYCVPVSSVGPTGANLEQLTCDADERCAPTLRVEDPDACFAPCNSVFGAGACLPAFLIPLESRGVLQPASCAMGELCSPCINPTNGMPTGACD